MLKFVSKCNTNSHISSLSDHKYIEIDLALSNEFSSNKMYHYKLITRKYNTKNTDWLKFNNDLSAKLTSLKPLVQSKTQADRFLSLFYSILGRNCARHLKQLKPKPLNDLDWFDDHCLQSKRKLNRLNNRFVKCKNALRSCYRIVYIEHRRSYKKLIESKKLGSFRTYLESTCNQNFFEK